jgi:hypothetical protein
MFHGNAGTRCKLSAAVWIKADSRLLESRRHGWNQRTAQPCANLAALVRYCRQTPALPIARRYIGKANVRHMRDYLAAYRHAPKRRTAALCVKV